MSEHASWAPITLGELLQLITEGLKKCSPEDIALYDRISIPPRKVGFHRPSGIEDVYVIAQIEDRFIFYDDVEDHFEVAALDKSGVLDFRGVGQFELQEAIAHIRLGWR